MVTRKKSLKQTINVMNVFIACHIEAYHLIHNIFQGRNWQKPKVTFAMHMRLFTPSRPNRLDSFGAKTIDYLFQTAFFKAAVLGKFSLPFKNLTVYGSGQYIDVIAINYYSRGIVHNFMDRVKTNVPKNDLGWEIYPEGIIKVAQQLHQIINLPIMITENGTCDNQDAFRSRYIYDHLKLICTSNLPFTHYYHWCFTDNFEWKEGEIARFGLVYTNYETQERTVKQSGYFYRDLIEQGEMTQSLYEKYVEESRYHYGEQNVLTGLLPEEVLRNKR